MNGRACLLSPIYSSVCAFSILCGTLPTFWDCPITLRTERWSESHLGISSHASFRVLYGRRVDGTLILSSRQAWHAVVIWRRALVVVEWALPLSDMLVGLERESAYKSTFESSV